MVRKVPVKVIVILDKVLRKRGVDVVVTLYRKPIPKTYIIDYIKITSKLYFYILYKINKKLRPI